jgi:hypothetical protein
LYRNLLWIEPINSPPSFSRDCTHNHCINQTWAFQLQKSLAV